jgi:hypothetical protein
MDYRDTMTDDALLAAYRRTRFCADTTQGRIVIRVGESRPELNAILGATGCETWTYVTAFNPGSGLSDAENDTRQRELEDTAHLLGHPVFLGRESATTGCGCPSGASLFGRDSASGLLCAGSAPVWPR